MRLLAIAVSPSLPTWLYWLNSDYPRANSEEVHQSVDTPLRDVVTERQHQTFENSYGQNKLSLGETDDSGAVEIWVEEDEVAELAKMEVRS
ncbi:DUF3386 family protein [Limnospira fusiformis]|uniref:DUF3386 family protein n=1 Tax=Limnospira indica PCC 8005 TaxID=376219 RepID=A0A9P1KLL6_9CYAN|nr:hypothetical protein B9S53_01445 [Arthrospira sp. O9.13F]CDM98022.1 conserved protein of unknown function [Limnospira indica PCC 8005]